MKRSILHTLRGRIAWLALAWAAGMLVALSARAADAAPTAAATTTNTLQTIDVQTLSGNQLQLTLHLAGPAPEPLSFTIDKPARISLDLPNTALALPSRRIDVGSAGVDTVLAAEANGRTRIVLNLDRQMPYQTRVSGNDIVVMLGAVSDTHAAARSSAAAAPHAAAAASGAGRAIKSIDFRRSESGGGRLVVRLSDPRTPIDLKQQGSQILVNFAGTELPKNLTRRYDTMDFGTPVTGFDAEKVNGDTRIVINANGNFEQLAYQSDDQYVVEVSPVRKAAGTNPADQRKEYKGERLTLNFQDIETRAVLQLLADASGQNIVVSDSVQGSVTLRLQNVPWDQALDIVLRTKGLDKRQEGNVIIVAPADELAAREKADLSAKKDIQALEPVRSEYLQVNYAKASDIAALLKGSGGGTGTNSVLSARGSVSVDDRTNTLLLQDTADRLADVRRLVTTLDIPVKQVLIESRIVIVTNDFERDLGARFGVTATRRNGTNGLYETTGTAAGTDTGISSALSNLATNGTQYPVSIPTGATVANRYNVNLPVATPAGSIALGILGSDFLVDLELSAAQIENRGTVISSPRVITANQKEASIEQGVEIPYQQSASSGATTIAFKKAVLSLKVKPLITPDNRIILDLTVSDDSVGTVVVASGGVNVPSINTRTIETQVVLGDGQTVVLGGILETTQSTQSTKVPWLGDVPILGNLFKETTRKDDKDELLIFVTPKILREGVSVN
ncbi:MAG TPA: type IV pilus secretin PilQ [Steroidobacteraceae bacterium]|nr:type IV pilus secretin PilQ [Steroidobacteraceae bacterium]